MNVGKQMIVREKSHFQDIPSRLEPTSLICGQNILRCLSDITIRWKIYGRNDMDCARQKHANFNFFSIYTYNLVLNIHLKPLSYYFIKLILSYVNSYVIVILLNNVHNC